LAACIAENVAFAGPAVANERQCFGPHQNPPGGAGDTPAYVLAADVDHLCLTRGVKMGKLRSGLRHRPAPETLRDPWQS
jgi:hypothetical protein